MTQGVWLIVIGFALLLSAISANEDDRVSVSKLASEICKVQPKWTLVQDPENCRKFYVCANNYIEGFTCGQGYHFSALNMRCELGNCEGTNGAVDVVVKPKCMKNSVKRLEDDCTSYELCLDGAYTRAECPHGFYFDNGVSGCLPVDVTPRHQCSCLLPEHATLANPSDCESYYVCKQGHAVLEQCPHGMYYDQARAACLLDQTGICLEEPTMPTMLTTEQQALHECKRTQSLLAPHTTNCSKYFACTEQRAIEISCPTGKYFDPVWRYCLNDDSNRCALADNTWTKSGNQNVATKMPLKVYVMNGNDKLLEVPLENKQLSKLMKIAQHIETANTQRLADYANEQTTEHNKQQTPPTISGYENLLRKFLKLLHI